MLSTKEISEISNLFASIIARVADTTLTLETLSLLTGCIRDTFSNIAEQHGQNDCECCKILFQHIIDSKLKKISAHSDSSFTSNKAR